MRRAHQGTKRVIRKNSSGRTLQVQAIPATRRTLTTRVAQIAMVRSPYYTRMKSQTIQIKEKQKILGKVEYENRKQYNS